MDNLKIILILAMLLLEACSRNSEQPGSQTQPEACKPYPSAYQVEFPDHTVQKATIENCGNSFTAISETESFSSPQLVIVVTDNVTGRQEYIFFDGQ